MESIIHIFKDKNGKLMYIGQKDTNISIDDIRFFIKHLNLFNLLSLYLTIVLIYNILASKINLFNIGFNLVITLTIFIT